MTAQPVTRDDPRRRRPAPRWLTVTEAAEYTRLKPRTIRKRIAEGNLRAFIPLGSRLIRIDLRDLDAMVAGREAR